MAMSQQAYWHIEASTKWLRVCLRQFNLPMTSLFKFYHGLPDRFQSTMDQHLSRQRLRGQRATRHHLDHYWINTLPAETRWLSFRRRRFQKHFLEQNHILVIQVSLKYIPIGPNVNMLALVQMMAWRRTSDKPSSNIGQVYWRTYASTALHILSVFRTYIASICISTKIMQLNCMIDNNKNKYIQLTSEILVVYPAFFKSIELHFLSPLDVFQNVLNVFRCSEWDSKYVLLLDIIFRSSGGCLPRKMFHQYWSSH